LRTAGVSASAGPSKLGYVFVHIPEANLDANDDILETLAPRDRDGSFEPVSIPKGDRRLLRQDVNERTAMVRNSGFILNHPLRQRTTSAAH
jgi:hypothetical protein